MTSECRCQSGDVQRNGPAAHSAAFSCYERAGFGGVGKTLLAKESRINLGNARALVGRRPRHPADAILESSPGPVHETRLNLHTPWMQAAWVSRCRAAL